MTLHKSIKEDSRIMINVESRENLIILGLKQILQYSDI